jgi:hypothetical protein
MSGEFAPTIAVAARAATNLCMLGTAASRVNHPVLVAISAI